MKVGRPALGCKRCGAPGRRGKELSRTGYCRNCGPAVSLEVEMQLHEHRGEYFQRWRLGQVMSAGGLLPEQFAALLEERM